MARKILKLSASYMRLWWVEFYTLFRIQEQDKVSLDIKKKRGSSINLDIHHSKDFSSGRFLPWGGLDCSRWGFLQISSLIFYYYYFRKKIWITNLWFIAGEGDKGRKGQGCNARKVISEVYASFVLQCTVSGR